jgi:hypothetical protein
MSAEVVRAAAAGALIRSLFDAKRKLRGSFDSGRGFESFVVDLCC